MSLGKFIAEKRKCLKMTQSDLADSIRVSKSAIAKWETDRGIPDRDNLHNLACVLNTSVDEMHHIANGTLGQDGEANITKDVIAVLETYGYKVIKN